ncbi:Fur family transcriptional regulator [Maritalea porphyrae]|uniref:Fur family transcriptional regulator n=1 Tax=Maritalea porphyrae TaxID=880732 RepID=UPI0022AF3C5B|nr:Fur family transcriptional regulator [Maritalea porphyrae]MCZ4273936.1 Fur family transcriptional regulator [Maritalea porphyrae]
MAQDLKLTKNQSLVFDKLSAAPGPLSAYDLLDQLRDQGLKAPLQIYRALEKLQEIDLVHRLESMNSFVACAQPNCHAKTGLVAFAICEKCGVVSEFSDEVVQTRLAAWADERSFTTTKTSLEIRGLCQGCG